MADPEIAAGRDPEYPSQIWINPQQCLHPHEYVRLQAGSFPPSDPEHLSVFKVDCFVCGTAWNQTNAPGWVYEFLGQLIAEGRFKVVGASGLDITGTVEWNRQTRYGAILDDLTGTGNPITDSAISGKDLLARYDR